MNSTNPRDRIPADTLAQIDAYVEQRVPPGGWLHAVLSNDLFTTFKKADDKNLAVLPAIVQHIDWGIPFLSRGSPENVRRWLSRTEGTTEEPASED